MESRGEALDAGGVNAAVSEAAELVSDSDLTVTAQTLQLATAVLRHQPAAGATVAQKARSAFIYPGRDNFVQCCNLHFGSMRRRCRFSHGECRQGKCGG